MPLTLKLNCINMKERLCTLSQKNWQGITFCHKNVHHSPFLLENWQILSLFSLICLKLSLYFGGFLTNNVNLDSFILWKKLQYLLLFWKSIVKLILVPKNFFMAGAEIEPVLLGFGTLNLTYPILTYTYRSAP